jgi:pantothenate kinase type III
VDPIKRTVDVHTTPDRFTRLKESETLDGGTLLPGFRLPLKQLFARVEKPQRQRRRRKPRVHLLLG